jgi:hypothetical protein
MISGSMLVLEQDVAGWFVKIVRSRLIGYKRRLAMQRVVLP